MININYINLMINDCSSWLITSWDSKYYSLYFGLKISHSQKLFKLCIWKIGSLIEGQSLYLWLDYFTIVRS